MVKSLGKVRGLGEIVESKGHFSTILKTLKGELITPRDEAYARLRTHKCKTRQNIGKDYGTWTSAGCEYVRGQLPILTMHSRLLTPVKRAVQINNRGRYYSTATTETYEDSLHIAEQEKNKYPKERSVIILPSRDDFTMTETENREVLETLLGDQALKYFQLIGPITFSPVSKDEVDFQNGTLLTQLSFESMKYGKSGFWGFVGINVYYNCNRGRRVCRNSCEAAQKISAAERSKLAFYTLDDIRGVLQTRGVSDIERIVEGLEELKNGN